VTTLDRPRPPIGIDRAAGRPGRRAWHLGRGGGGDPAWARPALLALLVATAVLYLWGLGASGWANSFYSAAVQAGATSWKAWFFGSFDSSNFITVDKPPAALWVMGLSARIFGVNAWSILVPQALMGVAAVGLLYATVRRRFGPGAGLLAGAVLAVTPVATLMFRFNNPDALLVVLLVGSAYAMTRALEAGQAKWVIAAGALIGFAFLAKMLQAVLVVPGFALVYLVAAPISVRRRLLHLLAGGGSLILAAGWWILAVALTPASARPYVGGSQHNSILELTLGYNGFGRLTGDETGSVGGGGGTGTGRWGATGWSRLLNGEMGGQVSWLLPAAVVLLVALLWLSRRAPRTDQRRAAVLLWGSWLLVTAVVFSYAKGIIHPYYTVALAPPIGALVGIGAVGLWRHRGRLGARVVLAAALAGTALWSYVLLDRTPSWHPVLRAGILLVGLAVSALVVGLPTLSGRGAPVVAGVALLPVLVAPLAYSLDTAATPHTGAIPSAGPAVAGGPGGGGPRFGARGGVAPRGGFPQGTFPGGPPQAGGGLAPFGRLGRTGGMGGGLLDAQKPSAALVQLLQQGSSNYTWVAAAVGANNAAGVQLAVDRPVMAIGGFNGSDPVPTLAQFQQLVRQGRVHYFLASGGGRGGPGGGAATASDITTWVTSTFSATTVGSSTVYDLSGAAGRTGT